MTPIEELLGQMEAAAACFQAATGETDPAVVEDLKAQFTQLLFLAKLGLLVREGGEEAAREDLIIRLNDDVEFCRQRSIDCRKIGDIAGADIAGNMCDDIREALAALTTAINQLDEVRAVALEEAARAAEACQYNYMSSEDSGFNNGCKKAATAIRALNIKPAAPSSLTTDAVNAH